MKTAIVVVLAALVAVACATECDTLTRLKVKGQWRRAYSTGTDRENFAQALWRAVFAQAPQARALFSRVGGDDTNSGKFKAHAERVLASLDITINLLDQPEALTAQLNRLKEQHVPRNIPESYFQVFRSALGHVLPAQLGRCWDAAAWKACYTMIVQGIVG